MAPSNALNFMNAPDLILYNAKIATLAQQRPTVSAVAVEGGRVPTLDEINAVSDFFVL